MYALVESFSISYCSIQVLKKDPMNLYINYCANVYIKDSILLTLTKARADQLPFPNYKGSCGI